MLTKLIHIPIEIGFFTSIFKGIKNIFNSDVRYASPLEPYLTFIAPYATYAEDYPRPGRRWWAQIVYQL